MKLNVGNAERGVRGLAASALITCAFLAPLPWPVRAATFGVLGLYLMFTALAGTCLGYALIGRSTCPTDR